MRKLQWGAVVTAAMLLSSTAAFADDDDVHRGEPFEFEQMEYVPFQASDLAGAPALASSGSTGAVVKGFEGISQYDVAAVARNFIPPDTMGAVGTTQYMAFANGGVAIYDKATGARTSFQSDVAFWAAAGQDGANGDSRVMFNAQANKWIALSFGSSVSDIQIAVSQTANANGPWTSTKFTGQAGGTADYPTLAIDTNAVYIGTNNFNGTGNFVGTSLNVIPVSSLFNGSVSTAGIKTFTTPYPGTGQDYGWAIQGVNSTTAGTTGRVEASSLFNYDTLGYNINNVGTAGATRTGVVFADGQADHYQGNEPAFQPNQTPDGSPSADFENNDRVIDTLDDRISSSVYEVNGKIYEVHTITPIGGEHTVLQWLIKDANTHAVLGEGNIGDPEFDYYQGSLAVNSLGQVVIGYNRSGSDPLIGNITVAAEVFDTVGNQLVQRGGENVLKVSLVDDYHNGSVDGQVAAGRQRWGDYSSVSLDPTDPSKFWVIGEFAREYNDAPGGHPGGTGGSRWSEWISEIDASYVPTAGVPEPATWATMIMGFGLVGAAARRSRRTLQAV